MIIIIIRNKLRSRFVDLSSIRSCLKCILQIMGLLRFHIEPFKLTLCYLYQYLERALKSHFSYRCKIANGHRGVLLYKFFVSFRYLPSFYRLLFASLAPPLFFSLLLSLSLLPFLFLLFSSCLCSDIAAVPLSAANTRRASCTLYLRRK